MTLPLEIEAKIREITGLDEPGKEQALRRSLYELADEFQGRDPNEDRYSDAYLAFNFPSNLMKMVSVMNEIKRVHPQVFTNRDRYDVLDIGCGEGAGMFGFFFARDRSALSGFSLRGIEASTKMLDKCRVITAHLASRYANLKVSLTRRRLTPVLEREIEGNYDAILCVNSLAEIIPTNPLHTGLVTGMLRHLKPEGIIVIIEPALKDLTRRLMILRDELLSTTKVRVVLPCFHQAACPLLRITNREEWCHETRAWSPPEYLVRLNRGLNREIDRLKFSYLVISRKSSPELETPGYRVISRRVKEKGKIKFYLCGARRRMELVRLDKDQSDSNAAFDKIRQGDVISFENAERKGDKVQVKKETNLALLFDRFEEQTSGIATRPLVARNDK